MPSKNYPWLEMQNFSRCNHFLKASRYADLGTVIRYWWIAGQSACQDWYFRPARNYFNFGNIKKSHGAISRENGRWGKKVTFSFFKKRRNYWVGMTKSFFPFCCFANLTKIFCHFAVLLTLPGLWAGTLPCRRRIYLKPVTGRRFR